VQPLALVADTAGAECKDDAAPEEDDAAHPASPSRRYEHHEDAPAAESQPSASATASSPPIVVCSSNDESPPSIADLSPLGSGVHPANSSSVSVHVDPPTPSGAGEAGPEPTVQWSATSLYGTEERGSSVPRLPQLMPRRPAMLLVNESASSAGQLASSSGGRSLRTVSGAVQLAPLAHRRTASAATAVTVKLHLPPTIAVAPRDRPASAEPPTQPPGSATETTRADAASAAAAEGTIAVHLSPTSLPPLRKPPRLLLVPVPRASAAAASPSSSPFVPPVPSTVASSAAAAGSRNEPATHTPRTSAGERTQGTDATAVAPTGATMEREDA
jgi:hypothetical protein